MAKRLTKALAEKGVGSVLVSPEIKSKSQMVSSIEKLSQTLKLSSKPKIVDFSINN